MLYTSYYNVMFCGVSKEDGGVGSYSLSRYVFDTHFCFDDVYLRNLINKNNIIYKE